MTVGGAPRASPPVEARATRPTAPWRVDDIVVLYVTQFAAAVLLLVAWWGASGTSRLGDQVAWVNVGVAGLIVSGTGIALWLLHGHRAVGERQRLLLADLEPAPPADAVPVGEGDAAIVAGSRMTRYHRTHCPLVAGKRVRRASRDVHERAGRRPCGMCMP